MSRHSPLKQRHVDDAAMFLSYGPEESAIRLPAMFGEPELEYAAVRKTAGLMDLPQRGLLRVTGIDRIGFLDGMLTQAVTDAELGAVRQSFQLNRKGRIQADFTLIFEDDAVLINVDVHQAARAAQSLAEYIIADDVEIRDMSEQHHQFALHGPKAALYLARVVEGGEKGEEAERMFALANLRSTDVTLAGRKAIVYREDLAGVPGLNVILSRDDATEVYDSLVEKCIAPEEAREFEMRRLGWSAFNVARIEAGTPIMNIDFGETNLPHETGLLRSRVSFTKGCYLGQEIVARIESQGQPKQKLMALKVAGEKMPQSGDHVLDPAKEAAVVGAVTSSAPSPLLGSTPICLAMLRATFAQAGTQVRVIAEGSQAKATVEELGFVGLASIGQ